MNNADNQGDWSGMEINALGKIQVHLDRYRVPLDQAFCILLSPHDVQTSKVKTVANNETKDLILINKPRNTSFCLDRPDIGLMPLIKVNQARCVFEQVKGHGYVASQLVQGFIFQIRPRHHDMRVEF